MPINPEWVNQGWNVLQQLYQALSLYGPRVYVEVTQFAQGLYQLVQTYGPWGPAIQERISQFSQEASRRINNASQSGEPAGTGDPWRWGKDWCENYESYYGVTRDPKYQVNHILPRKYAEILQKAGINVNDPRWLREIQSNPELGNLHQRNYTNAWEQWARGLGHTPTAREIVEYAQTLEARYLEAYGTAFYRSGEGMPGTVDWQALWNLIQQYEAAQQYGGVP